MTIASIDLGPRAHHDVLTGLANRKRLNEVISHTTAGTHVAVLFVDIDHFKKINDVHGHAVGDVVLEQVGRRVSEAVGDGHLVARVCGDEIVIWAPGLVEVESLAQRLVDGVASVPVVLEDGSAAIDVAVTVGAASGPSERSSALMKYADAALQEGKQLGRNRCCVAPRLS